METNITFPFDKDIPDTRDLSGTHPYSTFNSSTGRMREIWAIVAMAENGAIGYRGDMPWHIPEDLRRFKAITTGHPVIMGRNTWLSLPRRPLPGRRNIVISRTADYSAEGAEMATSVEEAIALCPSQEIPVIIGGGKVYHDALHLCSKLFVTLVLKDIDPADTFFPKIDPEIWKITDESDVFISLSGISYRYITYTRR